MFCKICKAQNMGTYLKKRGYFWRYGTQYPDSPYFAVYRWPVSQVKRIPKKMENWYFVSYVDRSAFLQSDKFNGG